MAAAAAVFSIALTSCDETHLATPTPEPPSARCVTAHELTTAQANTLTLTPTDIGGSYHQISAGPLKLSGNGPDRFTDNTYQVVFATSDGTAKVVSQAIVASSVSEASVAYEGALRNIATNPPSAGARGLPIARLCDQSTVGTATANGKTTYTVSWQHGNVFAQVVGFHDGADPEVVAADLVGIAKIADTHITAALNNGH